MKLRHPVLERIGAEAVQSMIDEGMVFKLREVNAYQGPCNEQGRCVVGELMVRAGRDLGAFPRSGQVATVLGLINASTSAAELHAWGFISALMRQNDEGKLRTPEAVRAALVVEEEAHGQD